MKWKGSSPMSSGDGGSASVLGRACVLDSAIAQEARAPSASGLRTVVETDPSNGAHRS
jgi:hypothetical protein